MSNNPPPSKNSSSNTPPPSKNNSSNQQPSKNNSSNTPPPSNGSSNQQPPSNDSSNQPPPSNGSSNQQPPSNGSSNQQPPSNDSSNTPPPSNDSSNTPPPSNDSSNQQPPSNDSNNTPPDSNNENNSAKHTLNNIFNQSNIALLLWFLAIYFIAYFLIGFFVKRDVATSSSSSVYFFLDIVIFGSIIGYLIFHYYNMSQNEQENADKNITDDIKSKLSDPATFVQAFIFLVIFNIVLYLFRIPTSGEDKPYFVGFFGGLAWIVFTISIIVWFFNKFLGVDLFSGNFLSKLFDKKDDEPPKDDEKQNGNDEVFNISNNLYTYDDAKAVCSAYGARLATYTEIENAYNKGAEWCNYGWSDSQMAFFPTQKSTWDELQKNPKHKNDCGRPGVNGGYMANPYIQFGVNCYGQKPKPSDRDLQEMDANKNVIYPKTPEEQKLDEKAEFWKENADKMLNINSFNKQKWSEY